MDSTSDAVALADMEGWITYVNSAFLDVWGLNRQEEALGRHCLSFWEDASHAERVMRGNIEGDWASARLIAVRDDGLLIPVQCTANTVKDDKGSPICLMGIFRDVTKQKKAERELFEAKAKAEAAHQRLLAVMNNIDSIIYVTDLETHEILFMNEFGQMKWGCVEGEKCWDVIHPGQSDPCSFCENLGLLNEQGQPTGSFQLEYQDKNDKTWYERHVSSINWIDGRLVRMHFMRDITKRKLAEEEIKLANQQLLTVNAEKDKLFSIIAHDLRAPMSGLLTSTAALARELETFSAAELQSILDELYKSSKNTFALLDNLLHWSKINQGGIDFSPGPCTLNELLNMSLPAAQSLARQKAIQIMADIPDGLTVMVDQHMAKTVIRNLLFNAVKFTDRGGEICISAQPGKGVVRMAVQDNGIGIDPKILPDLFAVSRKKRQLGTAGEKGTGLGLILCKQFVEKHGGQIWVESEPGKGTTVHITLPDGKIEERFSREI